MENIEKWVKMTRQETNCWTFPTDGQDSKASSSSSTWPSSCQKTIMRCICAAGQSQPLSLSSTWLRSAKLFFFLFGNCQATGQGFVLKFFSRKHNNNARVPRHHHKSRRPPFSVRIEESVSVSSWPNERSVKPLTKNKSDLNNNFFAKYSYIHTLYPKQGGNRMFVRDFNISEEKQKINEI